MWQLNTIVIHVVIGWLGMFKKKIGLHIMKIKGNTSLYNLPRSPLGGAVKHLKKMKLPLSSFSSFLSASDNEKPTRDLADNIFHQMIELFF